MFIHRIAGVGFGILLGLGVLGGERVRAQDTPPSEKTPPAATTTTSPTSGFAQKGTWLPTGAVSVNYVRWRRSFGASHGTWRLQLTPGIAYFVLPRLAVGAAFEFGLVRGQEDANGIRTNSTTFGVAPTLTYAVPLGHPRLSLLAQGWIRYGLERTTLADAAVSGIFTDVQFQHNLGLGMFAPVVWLITEHVFVGMGPEASVVVWSKIARSNGAALATSDDQWRVGLRALLGVWF